MWNGTAPPQSQGPPADYLIVLYSKYSDACKQFIAAYQQNSVAHIRTICVDNTTVRTNLYKSARIRVSTVPAVVMVYPSQRIELFEGDRVLDFLLQQVALPTVQVATQPMQPAVAATELVPQPMPSPPVDPQQQLLQQQHTQLLQQPVVVTPLPVEAPIGGGKHMTAAEMQKERADAENVLNQQIAAHKSQMLAPAEPQQKPQQIAQQSITRAAQEMLQGRS